MFLCEEAMKEERKGVFLVVALSFSQGYMKWTSFLWPVAGIMGISVASKATKE